MNQSSGSSSNGRVRFEGLLASKEVHEVTIENVLAEWGQALSDKEMGAALERRFLELQPPPCCISLICFRRGLKTWLTSSMCLAIPCSPCLPKTSPLSSREGKSTGTPGEWRSALQWWWRREERHLVTRSWRQTPSKALRTDYVAANIKVPEIFPILLSSIPRMQRDGSNTTNKEDQASEVEKYLDTQAPASVIYISFGSLAALPEKNTEALALALEAANYPFVWVYRPPGIPQVSRHSSSHSTTHANSHEYFPLGFPDRVSGRAVLLAAGLQKMNARFITDTAQVGLRIHRNADDTVVQDEIEKVLKQNVADGGASTTNLDKILQQCCTSDSVPPFQQCCTPASPFTHQTSDRSDCK